MVVSRDSKDYARVDFATSNLIPYQLKKTEKKKLTDAQTSSILRIVNPQILLQPAQPRRRNIIPIQVIHDINDDEERAAQIQLQLQSLLHLLPSLGIHGAGRSGISTAELDLLPCVRVDRLSIVRRHVAE